MSPATPEDDLTKLLKCAAIEPGLRSILCFDASQEAFELVAARMETLLRAAGVKAIRSVILSRSDSEDDLWGQLRLLAGERGPRLEWKPGRLISAGGELVLVQIPDLTRLSLAAQRACVTLLSSDAGHLERHGQAHTWATNYCWLSACPRARIGELSPHLIDRFVLRTSLPEGRTTRQQRIAWIRSQLEERERKPSITAPEVELRQGTISVSGDLLPTVLRIAGEETPSPRREITLARLAVSLARLEGKPVADAGSVQAAARLIGLKETAKDVEQQKPEPPPISREELETDKAPPPVADSPVTKPAAPGAPAPLTETEADTRSLETIEPDQVEILAASAVPANPYEEDAAPVQRELLSLRLPPRRTTAARSNEGIIVGTEPAHHLSDIAWVSTILEAAKYQRVRQRRGGKLLITRSDLRANRRAPVPHRALVVVLDHTCLGGVDWQTAIGPHIFWAYTQRAMAGVIQVGAKDADGNTPLRARLVTGRNLLAPAVIQAFESPAGAATPLAHGLDLALHYLRHSLQHGRGKVDGARLVVVTDGLGNIPLAASQAGELTAPAGAQGMEDALKIAAEFKKLPGVDRFLLYPGNEFLPDLPERYRVALGGDSAEMVEAAGGAP